MVTGNQTARDQIETAFRRFETSVLADDARAFHLTTLHDVRRAALAIEEQQRKRGSLRNMKRIDPLLGALEVYSKPLDILCNGTPFLPWIWAPVKLMLQVVQTLASQYISSFDKLMDAYAKIADSLPRVDRYAHSITDEDFQSILALVYIDILEFHRRAYKYFRRRAWQLLFESGWKSFEKRFEHILQQLSYHRDLIDKEAVSFDIVAATESRRRIDEDINKAEEERTNSHLQAVLSWLCVNDVDQENYLWRLIDKRFDDTCDWLFHVREYKQWHKDRAKGSIIWLTGIPGSGKSVFSASIIQRLRQEPDTTTLFCFGHHNTEPTDHLSTLLRIFTTQLVRSHPDFAALVWDDHVRQAHVPSIKIMQEMLIKLIVSAPGVRVVLDGLDESPPKQHLQILDMLIKLAKRASCGVLISSRDEGQIGTKLRSKSLISLRDNQAAVDLDMCAYVKGRLLQAIEEWDLEMTPRTQETVETELLRRSNGMFLWVELVIGNLRYALSDDDFIRKTLELPETLQEAYDRIVSRIITIDNRDLRVKLMRLLEFVTSASRVLSIEELLSALSFDPSDFSDHLPVPVSKKVMEFCKPLIEVSSTGVVDFVHFSAREYFYDPSSRYKLHQVPATLTIAHACLAYLSTTALFFDCSEKNLRLQQIVSEQRAFHCYAAEYWDLHLEFCLKHRYDDGCHDLTALGLRVRRLFWLLDRSAIEQSSEMSVNGSLKEGTTDDKFPTGTDDLLRRYVAFKDNATSNILKTKESIGEEVLLSVPDSSSIANLTPAPFEYQPKRSDNEYSSDAQQMEIEDPTRLSMLTACYEAEVSEILSLTEDHLPEGISNEAFQKFRDRNIAGAYTCRFHRCPGRKTLRFFSLEEREKHESIHFPRLQCPKPYCVWRDIGFNNKDALASHMRHYHPDLSQGQGLKIPDLPASRTDVALPIPALDLTSDEGEDWSKLSKLNIDDVPDDQKSVGRDWFAVFKPLRHSHYDMNLIWHQLHDSVVCHVAFSPDGCYLAVGMNHFACVYQVGSFQLERRFRYELGPEEFHDNYIRSVCFSHDSKQLYTGDEDGGVRQWNLKKGSLGFIFKGHEHDVYRLDVSSDGRLLASGSGDRTVRLWALQTGLAVIVLSIEDGITSVAFSADGTKIGAGSLDKCARVWDTSSGHLIARIHGEHGHLDSIYDIKFGLHLPDGRDYLLTCSLDKTIKLWLVGYPETGKKGLNSSECLVTFRGHEDYVLSSSFIPDSPFIISTSKDRSLRLWNWMTGATEMVLEGHKNSVIYAAVSPDRTLFATVSGDQQLRVWHYRGLQQHEGIINML